MAAIESERKWRFALLLLVIEVCMPVHAVVSTRNTNILEWIDQRHSNDFYNFVNNSSSIYCGPDGNTYLISENQCITDQELFKGN